MFNHNVQSPSLHLKKGDFQGLISTKNSGAETVSKKGGKKGKGTSQEHFIDLFELQL